GSTVPSRSRLSSRSPTIRRSRPACAIWSPPLSAEPMGGLHLKPWEPEETIGTLWHRLVGRQDEAAADRGSAVTLDQMRGRMGVLLRGLGGSGAMEIRQAGRERTARRRGFLERL